MQPHLRKSFQISVNPFRSGFCQSVPIRVLSIRSDPGFVNPFRSDPIRVLLMPFVLHFVFLPRINVAIDSFVNAWNRHPVRTEQNWSPEQMWANGMLDITNRHLLAVADVRNECERSEDLAWFGHDPHAPLPPDDGLSTVEVNA